MNTALKLTYRYRQVGKRVLTHLGRILPRAVFAPLRRMAEQVAYRAWPEHQTDTLPPIFHFWSARYVSPVLARHGANSPEQFYLNEILLLAAGLDTPLRIISFGSGDCSLELELRCLLRKYGVEATVSCVDFNADLLLRGKTAADALGMADGMQFLKLDCNRLPELGIHDVIVVNQFFHHVENLEGFSRALRQSLAPWGRLLTSDVIGRNGHQLWPDIQESVTRFWGMLAPNRRYDRYFEGIQHEYRVVDHAAYSNEGIRSQDVVRCLLAEFEFDVFLSYGGSVIPFVERRIGFNFDASDAGDQAFINQVAADDAMALANGRYPASNMVASLVHKGCALRRAFDPVSPEAHAQLTVDQQRKLTRAAA